MANLADTAQITMDLYYQNYKTDEDFFKLKHFLYLSGVAYSKLLEEEYILARKEAKLEEGLTDIVLADDWLIEQTLELKPAEIEDTYEAPLAKPLFSFPYDPYSFGLQSVRPAGKSLCPVFIRTSLRESWMDCILPATKNVFFYVAGGKLRVRSNGCKPDKVILLMVPDITAEAFGEAGGPVPKTKEDPIIRKTLEIMLRAREGVVVDMSNNSNPNKVMQTEIDTMFPNLRTKPV
jgi:hypothetical protein